MISLAKISEVISFLQEEKSIFAVKQLACSESTFWFLQNEKKKAELLISAFSNTITLCGNISDENIEELLEFLQYMGGYVEGDLCLLSRLTKTVRELFVMLTPPNVLFDENIYIPERLAPIYKLLCDSDEEFAITSQYDAWLADFSHRCRHGISQCFVLMEENILIGTCSVLFHANGRAIAGAMAITPKYRGKGYGIRLLRHVAAYCEKQKEQLFLITADKHLAEYYSKHGWIKSNMAANINMEEI